MNLSRRKIEEVLNEDLNPEVIMEFSLTIRSKEESKIAAGKKKRNEG